MKAISINAARALGKKSGARNVVILALDDQDGYCITTWGKTTRECKGLANWAESPKAIAVLRAIAVAGLGAGVVSFAGGSVSVALDPEDRSEIGVE
jgi:hypothetical protein